ncbi:FAD-dependent oxidoreductase [Thermodesulfobacteriota bacterium]
MQKLNKLFEPGMIGKLKLKNRIVMAPMGTGYCHPEGYINTHYKAFLEERAKGGVGLIITGVTRVLSEVGMRPGSMGIYHDKLIPAFKEMTEVIKSYGTKIFVQLHHSGLQGSDETLCRPVVPSAIPHIKIGIVPKVLSVKEIRNLVEAYGEAARRAKDAGFDGVEIHGGHGYLLFQFLSPRSNRRTDDYGGSVINRTRFACEIIKQIRSGMGTNFPISFRMSADEFVEGGIDINDAIAQAQLLVDAGADVLHVSAGAFEAHQWCTPDYYHPPICLTPLAADIKKSVKVPIIAVGKLGDPVVANQVLTDGKADFVAMGRPLLADPELPNKAKKGSLEDICMCISCNNGCTQNRLEDKNRCAINPLVGQELVYRFEPVSIKKRAVVVGGGLAGMEAAIILAERGHEVSLYERSDRLGGQWNIVAGIKPQVSSLTRYLNRRLEATGVKLFLNTEVNAQFIQELNPDIVVIATGAGQIVPDISGIDNKNVVMAWDVLLDRIDVGDEVVVIGGRLVGSDTALFLAKQGKKVSLVDQIGILADVGRLTKLTLKEELVKHGVYMYPHSPVDSITGRGVNIVSDGEIMFLRANSIVIAAGSKPENLIVRELEELLPDLEMRMIGDCVGPRDALAAIHEGFKAGNEL